MKSSELNDLDSILPMSLDCTKRIEKDYLIKILKKEEFKLFGKNIIKYAKIKQMIYRGSQHGFKAKDFHEQCDGKGPTISLFKLSNGECIGGYTQAQWTSVHGFLDNNHKDPCALVFPLSQ